MTFGEKGMVIRKRKDWLVGKEQEISGRESKQVCVEKKQEKENRDMKTKQRAVWAARGRTLSGAAFLQTHKPKFRNGYSKNLNANA